MLDNHDVQMLRRRRHVASNRENKTVRVLYSTLFDSYPSALSTAQFCRNDFPLDTSLGYLSSPPAAFSSSMSSSRLARGRAWTWEFRDSYFFPPPPPPPPSSPTFAYQNPPRRVKMIPIIRANASVREKMVHKALLRMLINWTYQKYSICLLVIWKEPCSERS